MPTWNNLRLLIIIFPVDSHYSFIIDVCCYMVERNISDYPAWAKSFIFKSDSCVWVRLNYITGSCFVIQIYRIDCLSMHVMQLRFWSQYTTQPLNLNEFILSTSSALSFRSILLALRASCQGVDWTLVMLLWSVVLLRASNHHVICQILCTHWY